LTLLVFNMFCFSG